MRSPLSRLAHGLTILLAVAASAAAQPPSAPPAPPTPPAGGAPAPPAAAPPPTCDAAEHRQFDFWAGEWWVETPDGKPAGSNVVRPVLNGCALEESWQGAGGSVGKSLNMYYRRDGKWHQSWVDGNGGRLDLAGGLDERGRMVLSGVMPGSDGGAVLHEISWETQPDGAVKQHWRVSRDGGAAWQDAFVGIYRPAGSD